MAPALAPGRRGAAAPEPEPKTEKVQLAAVSQREKALREAVRELRQKVEETADYVGDRFAEEARKIHYEETEARGIYGEATADEARSLNDEGIDFLPLPTLPKEAN